MNKCSHNKDNSMPKLYCRQIVYLDVYLYSIKPIKVQLQPFPLKPVQNVEYSNISVGGGYF